MKIFKSARRQRALVLCLVVSLALHLLLLVVLLRHWGTMHETEQQQEPVYVTISSALRLERRTLPKPPQPQRQPTPPRVVRPQPQRIAQQQPVTQAPHRVIPPKLHYSHDVTKPQVDIAQQEAMFTKEIARLRTADNPVVSAERPVSTPVAHRSSNFDFAAQVGTDPHAEGYLTPLQSWHDGSYTYYYVRYYVIYADGLTETGVVPWPIRYLPQDDPFAHHWEHFPLPSPLPDYVLPAGTNLHPLVAFCYEHRTQLSDCPIERDNQ